MAFQVLMMSNVCVYAYVCVRKRERENGRQRKKEREREREMDREIRQKRQALGTQRWRRCCNISSEIDANNERCTLWR